MMMMMMMVIRASDHAANDHVAIASWTDVVMSQSQGTKKVTRAKLGEDSSFYYDPVLKQWIDKNAPANANSESRERASAPPIIPSALIARREQGDGRMHANRVDGSTVAMTSNEERGSPRSPPANAGRARYVDVFANAGMTTASPGMTASIQGMSAFIPSAAPMGNAPSPIGMSFFVPAPASASESPRAEETLSLMQPLRRKANDGEGENAVGRDESRVVGGAIASAVVEAAVVEAASAEPTSPTAFDGGWADPEGDSRERWDGSSLEPALMSEFESYDHGGMTIATEDWAGDGGEATRWDAAAEPSTSSWESQYVEQSAAVVEDVAGWNVEPVAEIIAERSNDVAEGETVAEGEAWGGYVGHENYEYDPRWKFDEATQEWYWEGGGDDYENWVERAVHDSAIAELQATIDARVRELDEVRAAREALANAMVSTTRDKDAEIEALTTKVRTLELAIEERTGELVARNKTSNAEAFARGKEEGYAEGYAAGVADTQEELADLLVCLGQEGRRVEALRTMLAQTGADMDAIIAQFEAEEEAEIERLAANEIAGEDIRAETVVNAEPVVDEPVVEREEPQRWSNFALPEISASMHAAAAEIPTPERARDVAKISALNADAQEFILPTPPRGKRHERNLQSAFELA